MIINFGAIFGLVGGLVFGRIKTETISSSSYQFVLISALTGMISMFALLGAIFVGFKGAQMFKDEVEDGTFLIALSKPQSRGKIIFQK
jgi:ABC-type transport system involved in multi-copper enzyme maturation permease subunit